MNGKNIVSIPVMQESAAVALPALTDPKKKFSIRMPTKYTDTDREKLLSYHSDNHFYDSSWLIKNNRSEMNLQPHDRTVSFPDSLHKSTSTALRDYILNRLTDGAAVSTLKGEAYNVGACLSYLVAKPMERFNRNDLFQVFRSLMESERSLSTKGAMWQAFIRFLAGSGCQELADICKGYAAPKTKPVKHKNKLIPDTAVRLMDAVFRPEELSLCERGIYWTIRLFPCRIDEAVSMKSGCLKQVSDTEYILTIPMSKPEGNVDRALPKMLLIRNEGMGAFYINLIKEQQAYFDSIENPEDDFLWKYRCFVRPCNRASGYLKPLRTMSKDRFQELIRKHCKKHRICDNDGDPISLSTHMFRHNSVTGRLNSGFFRLLDVMSEAGHLSVTMTSQAYAHTVPAEGPIVFRGRVINTSNARAAAMILKNPMAKRMKLGMCSDTSDCAKNNAGCLKCEYFLPRSEYLDYYMEEYENWKLRRDIAASSGNASYAALCEEWMEGFYKVIERVQDAISKERKEP